MDMSDVAKRLEVRFGLGTRPDLRRALYLRLQRLVEENPLDLADRAYGVIAGVAADAAGKENPGNYFAYVVMQRLKERKILQSPEMAF